MPYNSTELYLIAQAGGGNGHTWRYEGTDTLGAVAAANFISDGYDRGMRVGDKVEVVQFATTDKAAVTARADMVVTAVSSTGATLRNAFFVAGTAVAGAVTVTGLIGRITTESLTTAAGAEYTLTITNPDVAAGDIVLASVDANGSAGTPGIGGCTANAGQIIITVTNLHAANAFNAPVRINFMVVKV